MTKQTQHMKPPRNEKKLQLMNRLGTVRKKKKKKKNTNVGGGRGRAQTNLLAQNPPLHRIRYSGYTRVYIIRRIFMIIVYKQLP